MAKGLHFGDIHTIQVESANLFAPKTGIIWDWCEDIAHGLQHWAKEFAPPNRNIGRRNYATGDLLAHIGSDVTLVSVKQLDIALWSGGSTVDKKGRNHSWYVLKGTGRQGSQYIYSTAGYRNRKEIGGWFKHNQLAGIRAESAASRAEGSGSLVMGPLPGGGYQLRVFGQRSNPYLTDAYTVVRSGHQGLPKQRFERTGLVDQWG